MTVPATPSEFRQYCKTAQHTGQTGGYCPGYAQANLVILPGKAAADFADLCMRNPVPLPLLGTTPIGDPTKIDNKNILDDEEFDITTDFPKYTVWEKGQLIDTVTDIKKYWDDKSHVGFLIGCSYSFENALANAGLPARNSVADKTVSMYLTSKKLDPAGMFSDCYYVVSMRPYKKEDVEKVRAVTREFRRTHGEPVDWGYEALKRLGISDLHKPDYGLPTEIAEDEVPVFWGCGVTAQVAALTVAGEIEGLTFGHAPGHMLVLDIKDGDVVKLK